MSIWCALLWSLAVSAFQDDVEPPAPVEPVPSPRQIAWQRMEMNAFVHFTVNTFTDREWGDGTESPEIFDPTALDCRQWAKVCQEAGFGGIILTAKHHDGFCLWPSEHTDHSVASSPFRSGEGDVLAELAAACREQGLKLGVYTSPWDRHEPSYGDSPRYNAHFLAQLREVLTSYGDIFEVWFDGANGEGPNGKRQVYDWPAYIALIRELQPGAVIFSDAGPDVRWVGNEHGVGGETSWSLLNRDEYVPGTPRYRELVEGQRDGTHWVAPEMDVSIRPGWFYHSSQDDQVKSGEALLDLYEKSVGRNGVLLLNIPPDRRGLFHESDVRELQEFARLREATYGQSRSREARALASVVRGDDARFGADRVLDGDPDSYWAADDEVRRATITLELKESTLFNRTVLSEPIAMGQRIASFRVEVPEGDDWRVLTRGTTIGNKRILTHPAVLTDAVRLVIEESRACPLISELSLHLAPPEVLIGLEGGVFFEKVRVDLTSDVPGAEIRYSLDGSDPTRGSLLFEGPFELERSSEIRARAFMKGGVARRATTAEVRILKKQDLRPAIHLFKAPAPGLRYAYYEGRWQSLHDLDAREPITRGECDRISLEMRRRDEHFALVFDGFVEVPESGVVTFTLRSDDGSRLWIGDDLLIDHDGLHGMSTKSGSAGLEAGWHPIRIAYFNATGGRGLSIGWSGPGIEEGTRPSFGR
ncbi:MAG: alpha-L-fucosidase [Planctomycetota bacterium]